MASEWTTLPLEDCMAAIIDYRGKSPEKTTFGVPLVTAKIVKGGRIEKPEEFIAEADFDEWMHRGMPKPGDIVMTTEAPLGEVAQLDGRKVALAQRVITLRGKPDVLDNTFLKFLLQSNSVQEELRSRGTGTTVIGIRQSELRKISLTLPPPAEQKAIAAVLGALDDKIELNRRMNATLEAMARALFQSWFVDFDPVRAKRDGQIPVGMDAATAALFPDAFVDSPLGMIPQGWEACTLGKIAKNVSVTFDFKRTPEVVFINTGDVLEGDFLHSNKCLHNSLPGQAKKSIRFNDILFSEIRPANKRYAYVDFDSNDYVVSTKFMIIQGSNAILPRLLYRILTIKEALDEFQVQAESRSGTFPQITFDSISHFPIVLPPIEIQETFQTAIGKLDVQTKLNKQQSRTLATLRDTLLPKLLSGELRVSDVASIEGLEP
jgi:type I restriction enzyme S subunit